MKLALESDLKEINTMSTAEFKRQVLYNELETRSKGTSQSGSISGSEPLSRKEFIFEGTKHNFPNSEQGSKASLSSLSSVPKGSKGSLASTTPPKGSKSSLLSSTPPKGSKSSLLSTTPPKGSKSSLVSSDTPPRQSAAKVNLGSEACPHDKKTTLVSTILVDSMPTQEESTSEPLENKGSVDNTSVSLISYALLFSGKFSFTPEKPCLFFVIVGCCTLEYPYSSFIDVLQELTGLSVDVASNSNDLMAFLQNW